MTVIVDSPTCHPNAKVRLDYFEGPGKTGWTKCLCDECGAILALIPIKQGKRMGTLVLVSDKNEARRS